MSHFTPTKMATVIKTDKTIHGLVGGTCRTTGSPINFWSEGKIINHFRKTFDRKIKIHVHKNNLHKMDIEVIHKDSKPKATPISLKEWIVLYTYKEQNKWETVLAKQNKWKTDLDSSMCESLKTLCEVKEVRYKIVHVWSHLYEVQGQTRLIHDDRNQTDVENWLEWSTKRVSGDDRRIRQENVPYL